MSSQSDTTGQPSKSGFHQAASFVERALSFRTNAQRTASSSSAANDDPSSSTSQRRALAKPAISAPLSAEDVKETAGSFPALSESQIKKLLPGAELEQAREWVTAALQEMHLNYDLDPKLLGERSDSNRGNALIALLLSRIVVRQPGSQDEEHERGEGHLSGAVVDQDGQSGRDTLSSNEGAKPKSALIAPPREYETHDLLKAIDKKDVETILAIRNANFDLLLDLSQGGGPAAKNSPAASQAGGSTNTPLGYAISLGKGWESVSIVLVGALSKFVNQLPDDEDEYENAPQAATTIGGTVTKVKKPKKLQLDPHTMARLRKIRVNLKLAIDHSIFQDQTSLLASYLQVLVMSEGSPFLISAIEDVAHCLTIRYSANSDGGADPVERSRSQVMQFVTDSLRHKSDKVAAVKDYIANAQSDLLLMSLWTLIKLSRSQLDAVQQSLGSGARGEAELGDLASPLPPFFFARDDRVASQFVTRLGKLVHAIDGLSGTRGPPAALVKLATRVAEALQEGARRKGSHERLQLVAGVLDGSKRA
ncbi:hypothetical protein EX895_000672 [Sporisorium graminicola]|uniref:Uncharacterized protein n=1 Tax=Sporisorium graminicola TaxID=280036 RepID=A0A4U7L0E7_9BASI|nr:hypothetical protein EX895_000672 [Sporisorium graminicola]TKY90674.1 hypothetical protein EX895_000672 [Sporisorium graminicola]